MTGAKLRSRAELNRALEGPRQPAGAAPLRTQRPPDRRAGHRRRHARARDDRAARVRPRGPDARDRAQRRLDLRRAIKQRRERAGLAQLVEQRFCKPKVAGSNPASGTAHCSRVRIGSPRADPGGVRPFVSAPSRRSSSPSSPLRSACQLGTATPPTSARGRWSSPTPRSAVDAGGLSVARRAEQRVVDADAGVALEAVPPIMPEGVDALVGMERADRVGPTLRDQLGELLARFGREQGVLGPALGLVDVQVGRDDVVVADQQRRHACCRAAPARAPCSWSSQASL